MSVKRLAVLVTSHNRRAKTLLCLERVRAQRCNSVAVDIVLVDDASTDGTADAVRERFPEVDLVSGSGDLYWNGGMGVAFERAIRRGYDYYVLLNDDTELADDAFARLLDTYHRVASVTDSPAIIVGSTRDPVSGRVNYGGWRSVGGLTRIDFRRVEPTDRPERCDTMNANCVMIPASVVQRVGSLDSGFTHSMGDLDYGFRASDAGCTLWITPGYVGECRSNSVTGSWKDPAIPVQERWRKLLGPKGLPPMEWLTFTRRHAGFLWPVYWANPYVKFWWMATFRRLRERFNV